MLGSSKELYASFSLALIMPFPKDFSPSALSFLVFNRLHTHTPRAAAPPPPPQVLFGFVYLIMCTSDKISWISLENREQ